VQGRVNLPRLQDTTTTAYGRTVFQFVFRQYRYESHFSEADIPASIKNPARMVELGGLARSHDSRRSCAGLGFIRMSRETKTPLRFIPRIGSRADPNEPGERYASHRTTLSAILVQIQPPVIIHDLQTW
jgi:hypothetical protein